MTEKCFFDNRKKCLVMEKMLSIDNVDVIRYGSINKPMKDWCPSCLMWQILQEIKKT